MSRVSRLLRLYWDAGCFIALFNWEATTTQERLEALKAAYEDMLLGHLKIVTSAMFRAEVFGSSFSGDAEKIYNDFLACKNFEIVEIRTEMYELVGEMRQKCLGAKPKQNIKTPDAIHMLMGNESKCDEIWTLDENLINKGKAGLIGDVRVCLPYLSQMRLDLDLNQ